MLHCKLVTQDSMIGLASSYNTSNSNFGNSFDSFTLRIFSEQLVDLMLKHHSASEVLGDWLAFSVDILECNFDGVLGFLKKSSSDPVKFKELRVFLGSLDESSLINAISNHTIFSFESYFFENLIEKIREQSFNDAPSRFESDLAFFSMKDATNYLDMTQDFHSDNSIALIELDTKDCSRVFEVDQNYLNQIDFEAPVHQAIGLIHGYWSKNATEVPLREVILQGTIRLKEQLSI